jgi:hypothetical protein
MKKAKRAYLLGGMPKCGSSSLQMALSLAHDELAQHGYWYEINNAIRTFNSPRSYFFEHSNLLLGLGLDSEYIHTGLRHWADSTGEGGNLVDRMLADGKTRDRDIGSFIFSSEYVYDASIEVLLRIRDKILSIVDSIEVVLFVKSPHLLLGSSLSQSFHMGICDPFISADDYDVEYDSRIRLLREVFDNVSVFPITNYCADKPMLDCVKVFSDYCLPIDLPNVRTNASLSLSLLIIAQLYVRSESFYSPNHEHLVPLLHKANQDAVGIKLKVSRSIASKLLNQTRMKVEEIPEWSSEIQRISELIPGGYLNKLKDRCDDDFLPAPGWMGDLRNQLEDWPTLVDYNTAFVNFVSRVLEANRILHEKSAIFEGKLHHLQNSVFF